MRKTTIELGVSDTADEITAYILKIVTASEALNLLGLVHQNLQEQYDADELYYAEHPRKTKPPQNDIWPYYATA